MLIFNKVYALLVYFCVQLLLGTAGVSGILQGAAQCNSMSLIQVAGMHWPGGSIMCVFDCHALSVMGPIICDAGAGEEELLLDALSVCGTPLAILSQTLAPAALLDLGLLPEEVALEPVSAPYKYMLVCRVRGVPLVPERPCASLLVHPQW